MTDELEVLLEEEQEELELEASLLSARPAEYAGARKINPDRGTKEGFLRTGQKDLRPVGPKEFEESGQEELGRLSPEGSIQNPQDGLEEGGRESIPAIAGGEPVSRYSKAEGEEIFLYAPGGKAVSVGGLRLRTVNARQASARTFYQTLMRARQAVSRQQRLVENSRMPLVREAEPAVGSNRDILRLDRAFQRDARRYDGGFTWQ